MPTTASCSFSHFASDFSQFFFSSNTPILGHPNSPSLNYFLLLSLLAFSTASIRSFSLDFFPRFGSIGVFLWYLGEKDPTFIQNAFLFRSLMMVGEWRGSWNREQGYRYKEGGGRTPKSWRPPHPPGKFFESCLCFL